MRPQVAPNISDHRHVAQGVFAPATSTVEQALQAHNTQPRSKGGLCGMCLVLAVQGNKQRHLMLRSRDLETEPHNGDCRTVLAEHSGTNTSNTLVREDAQNHRLRSHPGAGPSAIYHGRAELSRAGREEKKWKCCCQLQNVSDLSTATPLLFCWEKT